MDTMKKIWQPKHEMEACRIDENRFSFHFFHWRDKRRVLEGQPWHFDKHALCLSEIQDEGSRRSYSYNISRYGSSSITCPLRGRGSDENIRMLASKIGVCVKIDKSQVMEIDRSIRGNGGARYSEP